MPTETEKIFKLHYFCTAKNCVYRTQINENKHFCPFPHCVNMAVRKVTLPTKGANKK
jgi:hypothetical protein